MIICPFWMQALGPWKARDFPEPVPADITTSVPLRIEVIASICQSFGGNPNLAEIVSKTRSFNSFCL